MGDRSGNTPNPPLTARSGVTSERDPLQRRLKLRLLMRHYISQILFGCKYEQCETPTCLTCRNRRANEAAEPFRKPTELTARILAHCLAGQTNPQEGLCPNGLRVNPENLQVQRHQGQKDKRSLSQNLFDTASIIDSLNHVPTSHMDDPSSVHHRAVGENDSLFNLTIASLRCQVLEAWNSKLRQSHDPVCAPQPSIGKSGDSSCPTCKSIFLSLSDTGKICRFFETDFNNLNIVKLNTSFRDLELLTDSLVYDALWVALGPVFTPPAELAEANRSRAYLDDAEAAHLVIVCIHALASSQHRHSPWLRLATRLVEAISARLRFEHKARYCASLVGSISFLQEVLSYLARVDNESQGSSRPSVYADWLRAVIHSYWDGRAELSIWSAVGVAFQLAEVIYTRCPNWLVNDFEIYPLAHITNRVDWAVEPGQHIARSPQSNTFHLFDYPWWMTRQERIQYFRTVNLGTMIHNHQSSKQAQSLLARMGFDNISGDLYDLEDFVTLTVERDNILRDTFSNLRGQEKRFFRKPLKILMGRESGEIGQDEGGVTSEFFRQALKAVFQTRQGMFVIEESQMPWFQPASRVPDSHFEMLGLLFSLAVYNGVSLPVTFPVVLYHYLRDPCSVHSELSLLKDGWPSQYRSFTDFLHSVADYDNDTEQEYVFQFAVGEERVEVDMQAFRDSLWPADYSGTVKPLKGETGVKWPDSTPRPSLESPAWRRPNSDGEEVPLVTIANRHQFVQDYIYWLVIRSVAPQLEAFRKGFLTCLELKTLQVLTPDLLKLIVEGSGEVDVEELKKIAIYEDYKAGQAYIRDFWRVVQEFDMEDRRKLLAFVTASPRVPASGYNSMQFTIVSDGVHMDRLPSSSTCAGILYLPVYPSREILKEKLLLAIQNCEEFYLA